MAGKKRKLDLKSIEIKYQVIKAVEDGKKKKGEIAKEFNIPSSTLSTWIKNKEGIKEAFESASFGPSTKRMRTATQMWRKPWIYGSEMPEQQQPPSLVPSS